jgi:hypothetical protein
MTTEVAALAGGGMQDAAHLNRMRNCAVFLGEPAAGVVIECLDEIDRLRAERAALVADARRWRALLASFNDGSSATPVRYQRVMLPPTPAEIRSGRIDVRYEEQPIYRWVFEAAGVADLSEAIDNNIADAATQENRNG